MEDSPNAGYRPRFVSEFSMGNLDFDRFDKLIRFIEHWSAEINSTDTPSLDMVQHLFSGLVNLYDNWRPIISVKSKTEDLDEKIKTARTKKRIWESNVRVGNTPSIKFISDSVDNLMVIKRILMDLKQVIGLGIVVKRNMGSKERIHSAMKKTDKFSTLPEK